MSQVILNLKTMTFPKTQKSLSRQIFDTPWKINMEPENDGLEDDFPFQLGDF